MEDNSEVLLKYQKLAHEYSKLKAQTSVLKTAIADEQASASELQDTVKKKDQLIRKLEQEVECLSFRNLQLSKRVSILQNDLEVVDSSSKSKTKNSHHSAQSSESYNILNVELQSRIEENERLHQQVYAADVEHQKQVSELSSTVEQLRLDLSNLEQKLSDKIKEQEMTISTLQKEKIRMQVCLKNYEQDMKDQKLEVETKARDVSYVKEDLMLQLEDAKSVISNKIIFNDMNQDFLNALNVPIVQRGMHDHLSSSMHQMQTFISDFVRQLSDLHTFMIQRLCITSSDSSMKPIVLKLELHLRESIQHLKAIPESFAKITSAIKDETLAWDKSSVMDFSNTFQRYEKCLDKLLPFLILRIQNKDSWTGSSSKVIELSPKLVTLSRKLVYTFQKVFKYTQLLAVIGSAEKNVYCAMQSTLMRKIHSSIDSLQLFFDESRKLFGSKIASDHQLPMLSESEKSTDECILSALVSLSSSLKKIADLIEKDMNAFSSAIWYKPRIYSSARNPTVKDCVWKYKERGFNYVQHINQVEPQSIPYEVALKNYQTLLDHADNQENLTEQLEQYQNKLMQLELDKENWMLECQIMKAKESKNFESSTGSNDSKSQDYEEIHLFVKNTVNQLIKQIQLADSKSMAFRNECETLHQKLKMSFHKKEKLENDLESATHLVVQLKEDQNTLVESYEDQINTMSEHLANLNEILTSQKDEIDALKQAGSNKGSKKNKSK